MKGVGEGIAFAGLCVSAAALEIYGHRAAGLWFVICVWAFMTNWGDK